MSRYYWLKMSGCNLSEEKLRDIPCPRFELFTHIETKTIQTGAFLGSLTGAAISLGQGKRSFDEIVNSEYKYGLKGLKIGAALGPAVYIAWAASLKPETDAVRDRCYSIRHNRNQMFVDRMGVVGLAAGVGIAHYLTEDLGKGAFIGYTSGFVLAGVTNILSGLF